MYAQLRAAVCPAHGHMGAVTTLGSGSIAEQLQAQVPGLDTVLINAGYPWALQVVSSPLFVLKMSIDCHILSVLISSDSVALKMSSIFSLANCILGTFMFPERTDEGKQKELASCITLRTLSRFSADLRIGAGQVESGCKLTFNALSAESREHVTAHPFTKGRWNLDFEI